LFVVFRFSRFMLGRVDELEMHFAGICKSDQTKKQTGSTIGPQSTATGFRKRPSAGNFYIRFQYVPQINRIDRYCGPCGPQSKTTLPVETKPPLALCCNLITAKRTTPSAV
jgi:hypothetical protein